MSHLEMQVEALMNLCAAENEQDRERLRRELQGLLARKKKRNMQIDADYLTRQILLELGAPDHLVGHPYVIRAIVLVVGDCSYIHNITFGLYPQLAADFDTRPARVERAIRHLIEVTWARGDLDVLNRYFGNTVSADKGKPTNGEFIARVANVVRQKLRELDYPMQ